jgi:type II secretory pathway pseudopilin PulG
MKKSLQSILGVTLLEIMLVLAIASMVIIMSIRYYQSASNNQKVNAGLNTITGIVAAGESVMGATGSLPVGAAGTANDIRPYLPGNAMPNSPWGGPITLAGVTATSYSITLNTGAGCAQFLALITQNSKFSTSSTCTANTVNSVVITVSE